ncbi:MAG: phosphohistidine phosphatase SixA [Steroidobacteraceae bacterium]
MELLIVRHAIAFERDAHRWPDDDERPLSARGMARARKAAQGLKAISGRPARVLTSPLLRARQTAAILSQVAAWPRAVPCHQLMPGVGAPELLALLGRARDERLAVVGHEPGLGHLVSTCLPGGAKSAAFAFRKMGVALLEFKGPPRAGRGELVWFVPPRVLRCTR